MISKKKFLSKPPYFSASDRLGRNFSTVRNGLEIRKNFYLIKLVSKGKNAIRKRHTGCLLFNFWDLNLVQIDSALNSASGNLTHVGKNVGAVPRKVPKLGNTVNIFMKCPL